MVTVLGSLYAMSNTFVITFQSLKAFLTSAGWHCFVPGQVCSINSLTALALCQIDLKRMQVKSLSLTDFNVARVWKNKEVLDNDIQHP